MRWPWDKTEQRQQSGGAYTDAVVAAIVASSSGNSVGEPSALAALEIAAGLWSRAFASAEVSPEIPAVTPSFLASIARSLVRSGQSLWAIDILRGEIVLTPAASWDVAGGPDVRSWVYRLDLAAPSGAKTRIYPSASVLHFRYAPEPERPWTSPSPLGYARQTGKLAANLELRLGQEAGSRVGYLLPVPADGGDGSVDDPLASLKSDLGSLAGSVALVETTSAGYAEGRAAAPQSDWKAQRMGANPPATLAELRGAAAVDVLSGLRRPAWVSVRPIRRDFAEGELEALRNRYGRCRAHRVSGAFRQARHACVNHHIRGDGVRRHGRESSRRGRFRKGRITTFAGS